jgi:hypothetical protein
MDQKKNPGDVTGILQNIYSVYSAIMARSTVSISSALGLLK